MGILLARIVEWVAMPYSRGSSRSPTLQADSLPSEPPETRKNTVVGSLSLLQGNFLTQDSNWGLLHSRWFFTIWATREAHFSTASSTRGWTAKILTFSYHVKLRLAERILFSPMSKKQKTLKGAATEFSKRSKCSPHPTLSSWGCRTHPKLQTDASC